MYSSFTKLALCLSIVLLAMLQIPIVAAAQDKPEEDTTGWRMSLELGMTTTQTAYSDSWQGGESGSLNWVSSINATAAKQMATGFNLSSTLRLAFGQTLFQDPDTKKWIRPRKSDDLIDWEATGRFTLGHLVDPYAAMRIETQFYDGSVELKKRFINPLKITLSSGISRMFYEKENDKIISRLGLSLRQIRKNSVVGDTANLVFEDSTSTDGGIESVTDVQLALHANINYTGKLSLNKALFFSKKDHVKGTKAENYWKAIDVNWENTFTANITKVIAVKLYTQLLYDREIDLRGRFKQTMSLGLIMRLT